MKVIDSGINMAKVHMLRDADFLEGIDQPILHFYQFMPNAVTYGHFIEPTEWLQSVSENSARRPTGGGLIFHEQDFSFTLALPIDHPLAKLPTLSRYQLINSQLVKAINALVPSCDICLQQSAVDGTIDQLCMANPTTYDLIARQKKVAGAAQRKNKKACIHQCSLFLLEPNWQRISSDLINPETVVPKLQAFTGSIFNDSVPETFRHQLQATLSEFFSSIEKGC